MVSDTSMDDGRVGVADQALVASDGAASRLAPSGFDPSRIDFLAIEDVVARQLEDAEPILRKWHISWQQRDNGLRLIGFVLDEQDALRWNKSLRALVELAKSAPLFLRELKRAAIAMEAASAGETGGLDPKDDSADPKGIAHA